MHQGNACLESKRQDAPLIGARQANDIKKGEAKFSGFALISMLMLDQLRHYLPRKPSNTSAKLG